MACQFVDALLSSADVNTIGPKNWWDRAHAALLTGARASTRWSDCVSRAARKLQVTTLTGTSSVTVANLGLALEDPATYQRWARLAARDAVYVVARVRADRSTRRAAREPDPTAALAAHDLTDL